MAKVSANWIVVAMCAGLVVWVVATRKPTPDPVDAMRAAEQVEPIDQETIEGIGRYLRSDLEPWRQATADLPPLAEFMLPDGPTFVIEFDLQSGEIKQWVTMLDAATRAQAGDASDVDLIAESIYDGHVAEANGNGYIMGHLHHKYLNANYPVAKPSE